MKNLWTKIGCVMTGWNYSILMSCTEASKKQLKKFSSALLILIILWGLIGYLFASRYVQAPWWGCSIISVFMIIIVLQIERQIILTIEKHKGLAIFRIVIAFIMAILGSVIIDQIIFKDDIEKKMVEIVDRQVTKQLPNRLTVINSKLQEIQVEADSLTKINLELYSEIYKRPTINTVSTSTTQVPIKLDDGTITKVNQQTINNTPIANPKIKESELNAKHLEELRIQQEEYTKRKMEAENNLRTELKSKQGFLEELSAIIELLLERPVALIFYSILFVFLMSLELFVVMSKFYDKECDYELIIKHQLEQKKKTLNSLVKE